MNWSTLLSTLLFAFLVSCSQEGKSEFRSGLMTTKLTISRGSNDTWHLIYEFAAPRKEVAFGSALDGFRQRDWQINTDGVELVVENGKDVLKAQNPKALISTVAIQVEPREIELPKQYQSFAQMGDAGWVVYTGHFIPWLQDERELVALSFNPAAGEIVSAFGETAYSFTDWQSPYFHPAFVYFGTRPPVDENGMQSVVDVRAPAWIREALPILVPQLFDGLGLAFGRSLSATPNFFLGFSEGGTPGQLKYSGDALPGQIQIILTGGGWAMKSKASARLLEEATAHEAVHLWQAAIRPTNDRVPDWIHEGAADAIASELLVSIGRWSQTDAEIAFQKAKNECAGLLISKTLNDEVAAGNFRASYACGHVLNVVAAGQGQVTRFWRSLVQEAQSDGYDLQLFLALAERRGGEELATGIERFSRINNARPQIAIERLLAIEP